MTAAALAFPDGRTVAGFWLQLRAFHPSSLLLAHLSLYQVECLAQVERASRLDRMDVLTLEGLSLADLAAHGPLPFSAPVFQFVVRRLEKQGLVSVSEDQRWTLTTAGAKAIRTGTCTSSRQERRLLHFLDEADGSETPTFIDLHPRPGSFETVSEKHGFDLTWLRECVNRSDEWKRLHGFPMDIKAVIEPSYAGDAYTESEWPRVILVRAIQLVLALIRARPNQRDDRLIGFAVRQRDWHLFSDPILDRASGDPSLPPKWLREPTPEQWRQAWQAWAGSHQIADADAAACSLERRGHRLVVQVPQELWGRWRSTRTDVDRGETWLLAGEGSSRTAAELEWARPSKRR